jgi:AraC-like DNA-binding protein
LYVLSTLKLPKSCYHFPTHLDYNPLGRVEYATIQPDWIGTGFGRMRRWNSYQIVLILCGTGHYRDSEGRNFPLQAGDLFLTAPGVPHQYGPRVKERWTEIAIGFRGSLFDLWNRAGVLQPQAAPIHVKPLATWYRRLRTLSMPTRAERHDSALHALRVFAFLETLPLDKPYKRAHQQPEWLTKALSMIESQNVAKPYCVREIAQACRMGVHTFRRLFARHTGHGPMTHHRKYRLEMARRLLTSSNLSAKEIAEQLGFYDSAHFSATLKRNSGLGPRQFRAGKVGGDLPLPESGD